MKVKILVRYFRCSVTLLMSVLFGDANGDGVINAADIVTIVNIIMGR